jgi:hypothetical protein
MPYYPDVFEDRAKQITTGTGTGPLMLGSAAPGHNPLPAGGPSNVHFYYCIEQEDGSEWEIGIGYVSGGAIHRNDVLSNHLGGSGFGANVDFSAGTKFVSLVAPAELFSTFNNILKALSGKSFGNASGSTSDATPTSIIVDNLVPAPNDVGGYRAAYVTGTISAVSYSGGGAMAWSFTSVILNDAVTSFNATLLFSDGLSGCSVNSTMPFEFTVTGLAGTDIDWQVNLQIEFSRENGV